MKQFLSSLLSRKFLLALGTILTFVANKQYLEAMSVLMVYLGVQGYVDSKVSAKTTIISTPEIEAASAGLGAVDTSDVYTGAAAIRTFDQKDTNK